MDNNEKKTENGGQSFYAEAKDGFSKALETVEKKENNAYFMVVDTKGNPSGSLQYLYDLAAAVKNLGYKVSMLHMEDEFKGPGEWLGEKAMELPHLNVKKDNVQVSPVDLLFIPEAYTGILGDLKNLHCRKIMVVNNFKELTKFMPISLSPEMLGVTEVITSSEDQMAYIKECFPTLPTFVVRPSINPMFRNGDKLKKPIVNIISKDQADTAQIIKAFYWKYPMFKWVSFRDIRGLKQENIADMLREGAITVWVDRETWFGYSPLEALRSGSIVIGVVPDNMVDWMVEHTDQDGEEAIRPTDSILWTGNVKDVPMAISTVLNSWISGTIPEEVYKAIGNLDGKYTREDMAKDVSRVIEDNVVSHIKDSLKAAIEDADRRMAKAESMDKAAKDKKESK